MSNKTFKCNICNSKFVNNGKLKTHTKTIHNKIKDYECDKCNLSFSCNSHLILKVSCFSPCWCCGRVYTLTWQPVCLALRLALVQITF